MAEKSVAGIVIEVSSESLSRLTRGLNTAGRTAAMNAAKMAAFGKVAAMAAKASAIASVEKLGRAIATAGRVAAQGAVKMAQFAKAAASKAGDAIKGIAKGADLAEKAFKKAAIAAAILTAAIGVSIAKALEFRYSWDPAKKEILAFGRAMETTVARIGDLFIPLIRGLVQAFGPLLRRFQDWLAANEKIIQSGILEWGIKFANILTDVLGKALIWVTETFQGWSYVWKTVAADVDEFASKVAGTLGGLVAKIHNTVKDSPKLAEAFGIDGETSKKVALELLGLSIAYGKSAMNTRKANREAQASYDKTRQSIHAFIDTVKGGLGDALEKGAKAIGSTAHRANEPTEKLEEEAKKLSEALKELEATQRDADALLRNKLEKKNLIELTDEYENQVKILKKMQALIAMTAGMFTSDVTKKIQQDLAKQIAVTKSAQDALRSATEDQKNRYRELGEAAKEAQKFLGAPIKAQIKSLDDLEIAYKSTQVALAGTIASAQRAIKTPGADADTTRRMTSAIQKASAEADKARDAYFEAWKNRTEEYKRMFSGLFSDVAESAASAFSGVGQKIDGVVKTAKQAWGQFFAFLLGKLADRALNGLLDKLFSPPAVGGAEPGAGGIFGSIAKAFTGGLKFSEGGKVPGVYRGYDSVPAMLTPGETVLTRSQSQALSRMGVPGFARGGVVGMLANTGPKESPGAVFAGSLASIATGDVKTGLVRAFKAVGTNIVSSVAGGIMAKRAREETAKTLRVFDNTPRFEPLFVEARKRGELSDGALTPKIALLERHLGLIPDDGSPLIQAYQKASQLTPEERKLEAAPYVEAMERAEAVEDAARKGFSPSVDLFIKSAKKMAAGGIVKGGIPGRDSVPAMLMPGERVQTKREVDREKSGLSAERGGGPKVIYKESPTYVVPMFGRSSADFDRLNRDVIRPSAKRLERYRAKNARLE